MHVASEGSELGLGLKRVRDTKNGLSAFEPVYVELAASIRALHMQALFASC